MTRFFYKAKEGPHKVLTATIEAANFKSAIEKITQLGLVPLDVEESQDKEKSLSRSPRFLKPRINLSDKVLFTQQMSDLIEAAVPLLKSLHIVISQTQHPYSKELLTDIYERVKDGESFSGALARYPQIFSSLYVNIVRTGELSGQLEIVLKRLAQYLQQQEENSKKLKNSLAYPTLVAIVGFITIFVLLTFVFPKVAVMFEDLGQNLPLVTRVVVSVSSFLAKFWWLIALGLFMAGIYLKQFFSSKKGRDWFDRWILDVPVFGNFIRMVEIGRFVRTMATMIETGVPMTFALNSVMGTIHNNVLKKEVQKILQDVAQGQSLKNTLQQSLFFTEMSVNMIAVGEETGRLEQAFHKVADIYERDVDQQSKVILTWLGPLVLIFVVSLIGFVVIAMLLPILTMNLGL